jgi:hypothetical protein
MCAGVKGLAAREILTAAITRMHARAANHKVERGSLRHRFNAEGSFKSGDKFAGIVRDQRAVELQACENMVNPDFWKREAIPRLGSSEFLVSC